MANGVSRLKQGRYRRCYLEAAVTFQLAASILWKLTKNMEFSKALFSPLGVSAAAILLVDLDSILQDGLVRVRSLPRQQQKKIVIATRMKERFE